MHTHQRHAPAARFRPASVAKAHKMAGVGMIEVLVALLILSAGILGLTQLQGVATRQTYGSLLHSRAALLAYSIADRMRANPAQAQAYLIALTDAPPGGGSRSQADLRQWLDTLARQLPMGDGAITANGGLYTISVQYRAQGNPAGASAPAAVVTLTAAIAP